MMCHTNINGVIIERDYKMSKFELIKDSKKIGRAEKKVEDKSKKHYVRFVISTSFLQFSTDLWEECFKGMESIQLSKIDEDDNGDTVDWLFIKGHKEKVNLKNNKDLHKVHTRKGSGSRYLNLNFETFKNLNKKLNLTKGGVKSRAYGSSIEGKEYPDEYRSPTDNLIIVDFDWTKKKNWHNSSKTRVKTT